MASISSLAGHGNPDGYVTCDFEGQLYVDVDTSNLFSASSPAGGTSWNQLLKVTTDSAAFTGLVSSISASSAGSGSVAWITVSLTDLNSYLENGIVNVLNTKDLPTISSPARFDAAMTDVVNKIRAAIGSRPGNVVSTTPLTIPPELRMEACQMILLLMQDSCPAAGLTDKQIKRFEKSWDVLDDIRKGTIFISMPTDPSVPPMQGRAGIQVVSATTRRFTADTLRGI